MTPEGKVKAAIKKYLNTIPGCWHYSPMQNGMGITGLPDIVAVINGRFVGIECKAPGKEKNTTANQDRVLDAIRRAGGVAFVASDVHTVVSAFKAENIVC